MSIFCPGSRGKKRKMMEGKKEAGDTTSSKKTKTENCAKADGDAKSPKKKSLEYERENGNL